MWGDIAIAFLLAFITTFVLTPYTIKIAHKIGAIDIPKDERRMHKKAIPKFGGPAIIVGFLVSTIYLIFTSSLEGNLNIFGPEEYWLKLIGFLAGIITLSTFCYFDDVKGIHPLVKLLGQTIAASIVVACGVRIDYFDIPFLDGNIVLGTLNGPYTLPAGTHNITATDLAGNSTSITVTVNKAHDPNKDDGNCATAVTCKVCGDVLTQAKSHRYAWASGPEGHWMECQNAGCTSKTTSQRHVPGAAATEDTAQTCTVCGYTINPPLGHVCQNHLQKVNATAATCTQDGNNEYYKCTCGKIYSDTSAQNEKSESDFTIQATGHSYGTPVYTWSEDNLTCTAVRTCEICRDQESETETAVTQVTPKDGCKSPETTLYTVTFAGSAFAAQTKAVVTKEADAHTPSEWIVDKKATTAEAGSRHQECTECGTVLKTETIAKLTDSKANINPSGKNDADKNAGEKSASSVPGTGDTSLVDVWALLMAFAVLGGVYALCRQRKAR